MRQLRAPALCMGTALALQLAVAPIASADEKRGIEIGTKVDKTFTGYKGEAADVELQLVNAAGDEATRKMTSKLLESGNVEKGLVTLTWPADQKGVILLTWDYRDKDDDQWLFLPSVKRTKRISSSGRTGSFLGSEFTYEDMLRPWGVEKYKWNYIRDQKVGSNNTWVVERFPKDKHSGYSKQVAWIDMKYVAPLRVDYFDRKGKLLKSARFKDYKRYSDKWWRPDRIEMTNHQTGKKSTFVWKNRALGKSFAEDQFSSEALR
jgi:hypothetical protein